MTVLVFGKTGQVAQALRQLAPDAEFLGRSEADLMDPAACASAIRQRDVSAVINAAAWTAVDAAEDNRDAAFVVNAEAPAAMAKAAAEKGVPFVHISTDYVFDGAGETPFLPTDDTAPLGVYGASKLAGEEGVRAAGGVHAILRTSWVFSAWGANFVRTMLRLGATRDVLTIVADQIGGPTPAEDIARACLRIAEVLTDAPDTTGTYHFAGAPDISWADFAREIFRQADLRVEVQDIPSADYPTPAPRPLNSRLNCDATAGAFGITRPDWREGLAKTLQTLQTSDGNEGW